MGVLLLDLDHFSHINNTRGHLAGDHALRAVATELRRQVRDGDLVGRWGGEEFVVLLPGADPTAARQVAERIRAAVRAPLTDLPGAVHGTDGDLRITASLGVAAYPAHGATVDELLLAADTALYRAKRNGRDRVESAPAGTAG
jgi:diguanylate cyclase (GGDEF)-like protein